MRKGRTTRKFYCGIKKALRKVDDNERTLNTNNIDLALDALEVQTKND